MSAADYEARVGIIPIPLRPDVTIRIHGIPMDMTKAEAEKIAAVVLAYADEMPKPA